LRSSSSSGEFQQRGKQQGRCVCSSLAPLVSSSITGRDGEKTPQVDGTGSIELPPDFAQTSIIQPEPLIKK
jgi:hypothetical protein